MSVPDSVLQLLKCANCGNYLSYFPILIKNDTVICGRCKAKLPDGGAGLFRNIPYENLASTILFPCKNQHLGCKQRLLPSDMSQHEDKCVFTVISCPFVECKWVGPYTGLHQHYNDVHREAIISDQLELDLNKDLLMPFLFVYTEEDIFIITISLSKKLLVNSFSYVGSNHGKNFSCQLIITMDNDIYPLVISSSCNKYSKKGKPTVFNTAELNGQKAICHVKITKVFPKYKEYALSSSKKIHPEEYSNLISDFHYSCKHERNGCTYTTPIKQQIKQHEQECVFDERYDFKSAVCHICKETPFINYKSIWAHYTNIHPESVIANNNNKFTWNLDTKYNRFYLNYMNDIFSLEFSHRTGAHFQKFMWKMELLYQAVDVCKIYNFEVTIIDVTRNNRKLVIAGPTYFYHYCYDETIETEFDEKTCKICKDSLHLNREQIQDFIVGNELVFTVRIFKNNETQNTV